MKGVDTNILVRFLTRDDEIQAQAVYQLVKKTEEVKERLFVPLIVVVELLWVLESAYAIPRSSIIAAIGDLLLLPVFKFEQHRLVLETMAAASLGSHDLADLLIAHCAKHHGCEAVLTFDKRASSNIFFELLRTGEA